MKRKNAALALGLAIAALAATGARATVSGYRYTFDNVTTQSGTTDPTPVPKEPGVIFGSFSSVGCGPNPAASGSFTWASMETGGIDADDNFDDFTGSLNSGKYFQVTIAPEPGGTINITELSFSVRRSLTGARSYAVRSSLDGFAANLPGDSILANPNLGVAADNSFEWLYDSTPSRYQSGSILSLTSEFQLLAQPVTFRIYAWNAESSAGTFSIDDFCVFLTDKPVPEPSPAAVLGLGMIAVAVRRRQAPLTFARASRSRGCSGRA
jgi:hypothetical protein